MNGRRLGLILALAVVAATPACRTAAGPGVHLAAARRTTTTSPPTTGLATTTTTLDPGTLPQTNQLPADDHPLFLAHMADLFQAVAQDDPAEARPSFFPLSAYLQVKAISDPIHDYETRLIPDFDEDIGTIHDELGPGGASAVLTGVEVPASAAEWIVPGVEYNKGSYWRVYGTEVDYTLDGRSGSFEITSMISWRGEWYVVHLGAIR